jgi:tRNA (adenine37-N6)-methyltransferase
MPSQKTVQVKHCAGRRIAIGIRSGDCAGVKYLQTALRQYSRIIIGKRVPLGRVAMIEQVQAIGYVEADRPHAEDDFWGGEKACITLTEQFTAEALQGIGDFSHVEVLFLFHGVERSKIATGARHPRNNMEWPAVGIFAQRGKYRPNRIGSTICQVIRVEGTKLIVSELDAIDGTPVLDIKPVMVEFLPREEVRQPTWSHELMRQYWPLKR